MHLSNMQAIYIYIYIPMMHKQVECIYSRTHTSSILSEMSFMIKKACVCMSTYVRALSPAKTEAGSEDSWLLLR
jgi:hypothetical protein